MGCPILTLYSVSSNRRPVYMLNTITVACASLPFHVARIFVLPDCSPVIFPNSSIDTIESSSDEKLASYVTSVTVDPLRAFTTVSSVCPTVRV
ncbi:hypothetical protein D1872_242030 [compost metagenome]